MTKKLNPIERSRYINERYKDYLRSTLNLEKAIFKIIC